MTNICPQNYKFTAKERDPESSLDYLGARYYSSAMGRFTSSDSLSDSNHPGTPFSSAHYNAAGSLLSARLGNGISETRTYDPRLRLASISDGSLYSLTIPASGGYAPNSDILSANDSINGNWTYTYDDFNRLLTANATGQAYAYDYDRFGNRWHQNGPHSSQLGFDANNRITGVTGVGYDLAGNLTSDGSGPGAHAYFYDAENRIIQVDGTLGNCSTATACYVYNAEGQRVRKTTASTSVDFLYDLAGNQITELSSSGAWNRGEVYAGGRHLATYSGGTSGTTYFIHADWLGTERARSTAAGSSYETCTSLPFGDALTCSGSEPSPMHFTGKERDSESGLDNFGARYDSSSLGRFMSVDPSRQSANPANPQSWNRYAYALNNPLAYVDRNGLWPTRIHNEIYDAVFGGVLTRHQIDLIKRVSASQDSVFNGGQDPKNSNWHGQCTPTQNMTECTAGINSYVNGNLAVAWVQANLFGLTDAALTYFAKAGHTLTDSGSPSHAAPGGAPTTWFGIFRPDALDHVMGEKDESLDWYGIGQSVRNLIAGWMQLPPEEALRLGDPDKAAQRAIESIVGHYYGYPDRSNGSHLKEERARICALGNRAACYGF